MSASAAAMRTTVDPYPSSSESLATSLAGEIHRIRYILQQIHGRTYWYQDPDPLNPPGDIQVGVASSRSNVLIFHHSGSAFKTTLQANNATALGAYYLPPAPPTANNLPLTSTTGGTMSWEQGIAVAGGGTGLTAGTSGGVLAFTGSTTLASSGALTANGVVLGGGAGAVPTSTGAGTANQVLRVPGAGGAPAFGQVDLAQSAAVTGALALANGGTGLTTAADDTTLVSSGSAWVASAIPNCTAATTALQYATASNAFSCGTISAGLSAATQAEMETATSTTVAATPGRTQYHPGVAKVWVVGLNTTIDASYNVTSLTDDGVGLWTVNYTTAMSSGSYATITNARGTATILTATNSTVAGSSGVTAVTSTTGVAVDPTSFSFVAFGDQ